MHAQPSALATLDGVAKSFGAVRALAGVDLNGDANITDFVPGTTRNVFNRGHDEDMMAKVNAYRALTGLPALPASQIDTNEFFGVDLRAAPEQEAGDLDIAVLGSDMERRGAARGHDETVRSASPFSVPPAATARRRRAAGGPNLSRRVRASAAECAARSSGSPWSRSRP